MTYKTFDRRQGRKLAFVFQERNADARGPASAQGIVAPALDLEGDCSADIEGPHRPRTGNWRPHGLTNAFPARRLSGGIADARLDCAGQ